MISAAPVLDEAAVFCSGEPSPLLFLHTRIWNFPIQIYASLFSVVLEACENLFHTILGGSNALFMKREQNHWHPATMRYMRLAAIFISEMHFFM